MTPQAISPDDIIFGCGPITRKYGGPDQEVVNKAVDAALRAGIVRFDTAPLYGDSEDVLGKALSVSSLGHQAIIYTKAGKLVRRRDPGTSIVSLVPPADWDSLPIEDRVLLPDYTASGAFMSYRESLQRMKVERCHTMRIHDPDNVEGAIEQATSPDGLIGGLRNLRETGLIQQVSFGMNSNRGHMIVTPGTAGAETTPWPGPELILKMIRAVPDGTFDSCLLAYSWNLASQDGWEVFQECAKRGIQVHVAGIFGGLYHVNAGSGPMTRAEGRTSQDIRDRIAQWRELAASHDVSVEAVAVAFAALPSCVDKVVMGMKSDEEVERNLAAAEEASQVPDVIWKEAQELGLIRPEVRL